MVATTAVGSWPPPFGQRPALRPFWRGQATEDDPAVHAALVAAARIAMDEMLACGLDQIMGGEVFAPDFVHTVPPRLDGLAVEVARDVAKGQAGVARYRITGPITAPRGTGHAKAYRRERAIEPGLTKAAVPSALTMALSFPADPALADHLDDLVGVVVDEVADMVAAGATEIQLDAPSEAIACAHGTHPVDELADLLCRPFDQAGLASGGPVTRTVHFCLGDIARKPSTQVQNLHSLIPLLQACEGRIDRAHLECSYAGQWDDRALLAEVPTSIGIIAGIADVKSPPASVDHYARQIDELVAVVGQDRLAVSSSCGCGRVPHDEAITLMRSLVKAASA